MNLSLYSGNGPKHRVGLGAATTPSYAREGSISHIQSVAVLVSKDVPYGRGIAESTEASVWCSRGEPKPAGPVFEIQAT